MEKIKKTENWQEYSKKYYNDHREKYLEYFKEWNKNNVEKIKGYNKSYYERKKAEIIQKKKRCEYCDREYSSVNFSKHTASKKHIANVESAKK